MPDAILGGVILAFSIMGIAFLFQKDTRLFSAVMLLSTGGLAQWMVMAYHLHDQEHEVLVDTLPIYELKYKDKIVHVIYYNDKTHILEDLLDQEITSKEVSVLKKPSNWYYGIYFSDEHKYVQKQ